MLIRGHCEIVLGSGGGAFTVLALDDCAQGEVRLVRNGVAPVDLKVAAEFGLPVEVRGKTHTATVSRVIDFGDQDEAMQFLWDHIADIPNGPLTCTIKQLRSGVLVTVKTMANALVMPGNSGVTEAGVVHLEYTIIGGALT